MKCMFYAVCSSCPESPPVCLEGEVMTVDSNTMDHCCPAYQCGQRKHMPLVIYSCLISLHLLRKWTFREWNFVYTHNAFSFLSVIIHLWRCFWFVCAVCEPYRCPQLSCPVGMSVASVSSLGHCCPNQTCGMAHKTITTGPFLGSCTDTAQSVWDLDPPQSKTGWIFQSIIKYQYFSVSWYISLFVVRKLIYFVLVYLLSFQSVPVKRSPLQNVAWYFLNFSIKSFCLDMMTVYGADVMKPASKT